MSKEPLDDRLDNRLKGLFLELEGQVEPADGKPAPVRVLDKHIESAGWESGPSTKTKPLDSICPFLKTSWDATIRYGYPHEENVCYKPKKPRPVSLTDQEEVCLAISHRQCPAFRASGKDSQENGVFNQFFEFVKKRFV